MESLHQILREITKRVLNQRETSFKIKGFKSKTKDTIIQIEEIEIKRKD